MLEQFRRHWPDVDVDIRPGLAFDALPALLREEVDLVVSSDPEELPGVEFDRQCGSAWWAGCCGGEGVTHG